MPHDSPLGPEFLQRWGNTLRRETLRRTLAALTAAVLMAVLGLQVGYSQAKTYTMQPGESLAVSCASALTGTVGANTANLVCATLAPTQTPVAATATPAATTAPAHSPNWHAPSDHEHGDAPPSWVTAAGYTPSFDHPANTHSAFKGFILNDDGAQIYMIGHMDFNPGGHPSRFHSFQFWMRDPSQGVTHLHGWLDFGTGSNTGPTVRRNFCDNTDIRPIMSVNDYACTPDLRFETWYSAAGGYQGLGSLFPDFGWSINPNYYSGGDPMVPSTWRNTGYVRNLERRMEAAYYHDRDGRRGKFWTTQFGQSVTGPSDPKCGSAFTVGTRSYTTICLEQTVPATARSVTFPANSIQKTYPGSGTVKLPN
jgi:hypothetical protein